MAIFLPQQGVYRYAICSVVGGKGIIHHAISDSGNWQPIFRGLKCWLIQVVLFVMFFREYIDNANWDLGPQPRRWLTENLEHLHYPNHPQCQWGGGARLRYLYTPVFF